MSDQKTSRTPKEVLVCLTASHRLPRAEFDTTEIDGEFSSVAKVRVGKVGDESPMYLTGSSATALNKREAEQMAATKFLAKYSAMSRTWWSNQKAKARMQAPPKGAWREKAVASPRPQPRRVHRDRGERFAGRPAQTWGT